jgi:hypothetical protein
MIVRRPNAFNDHRPSNAIHRASDWLRVSCRCASCFATGGPPDGKPNPGRFQRSALHARSHFSGLRLRCDDRLGGVRPDADRLHVRVGLQTACRLLHGNVQRTGWFGPRRFSPLRPSAIVPPRLAKPNLEEAMEPISRAERHDALVRIATELDRQRLEAVRADAPMLAFLIASAKNEAERLAAQAD